MNQNAATEAPLYDGLSYTDQKYTLFTDSSCRLQRGQRLWKAALQSPLTHCIAKLSRREVPSQFTEARAMQIALEGGEGEKWPTWHTYTYSWRVTTRLCGNG